MSKAGMLSVDLASVQSWLFERFFSGCPEAPTVYVWSSFPWCECCFFLLFTVGPLSSSVSEVSSTQILSVGVWMPSQMVSLRLVLFSNFKYFQVGFLFHMSPHLINRKLLWTLCLFKLWNDSSGPLQKQLISLSTTEAVFQPISLVN